MASNQDRISNFYFVRHGVTEQNFRGLRCGGDVDVPLTDIGCDQAYLLAKQIQKMGIEIGLIVAGNLIRARQTALIMSGVLGGVTMESDPLLNERHLGEWNNKPIADTEAQLASNMTPPGGESEAEFTQRVAGAVENLRSRLERKLLVVSSKGVGRVLNTLLGGQGRLQVANGEVVEFALSQSTEGRQVLMLNRPHQV
jgi:probable phosphoglycerate mutase